MWEVATATLFQVNDVMFVGKEICLKSLLGPVTSVVYTRALRVSLEYY